MSKTMIIMAVTGSLMLAGCSAAGSGNAAPGTVPPAAQNYKAQGNEPGWTLEISPTEMDYKGDYGETLLRVRHSGPRQQSGKTVYDSPRLRVTIEQSGCADSMADRQYSDKVTIMADGKQVTGCGGLPIPPTKLDGTQWQILSIGGKVVLPDQQATLQFGNDRISGTAGCNRLSGSFAQQSDQITIGALATTRMACSPDLMAQEAAALAALQGNVAVNFAPSGHLLLRGANSAVIELRQIF